jgi:hypothetical protein
MYPKVVIDACHAQLALIDWSVGAIRGMPGWYVYGTNGENVIALVATGNETELKRAA